MKLTSQILSATSRMPTDWPPNTVLRLILGCQYKSCRTVSSGWSGHETGTPASPGGGTHVQKVYTPRRVLPAQVLMGPFVVVTLNEVIEVALLFAAGYSTVVWLLPS